MTRAAEIAAAWVELQSPESLHRIRPSVIRAARGKTTRAARLLEDTAKPGLPAAVDDRAIVRRMVHGVVANLTSLDLLMQFDPNDVVDDTEAGTLVAFADWIARRARKPKLRVVP